MKLKPLDIVKYDLNKVRITGIFEVLSEVGDDGYLNLKESGSSDSFYTKESNLILVCRHKARLDLADD